MQSQVNLQYVQINGETILPITLYGNNRSQEVTNWHRRVMVDYLNIPINYLECPFPGVSHGDMMNRWINATMDNPSTRPTYYLWLDNDAIFLKHGVLELVYSMVVNKITVYGQAWQSNHKYGPNGSIPHAYASQACLMYPTELYEKLGRPDMDHWLSRSDTAEELTYHAKLKGYQVALIYPSHSEVADTPLDNGCRYGLGNTYGPNLMYHVSQQSNPCSEPLFIEKCKEVIAGKYE